MCYSYRPRLSSASFCRCISSTSCNVLLWYSSNICRISSGSPPFTLKTGLIAALSAAPAVNTVHSAAIVPQMQAAELQAAPVQQGGTVFKFESAPVFHVTGGDPEDIDQKFRKYHDETMQDVEEMLRQKEQRGRKRYNNLLRRLLSRSLLHRARIIHYAFRLQRESLPL